MKEIKFPSFLAMDYPNLVSEPLAACMEVPFGERFVVDLTDLQKVSAFGVAALGARVAWLVRAKRMPSGSVVRRPESGRVSNDLMRMGLYNLLQEGSVSVFQKSMEQRPQELWLVDKPEDLENASGRLISLLRSVLPASEQNFDAVREMLHGLADNVFRHAKSNTGAMLCGQAFPSAGVVEFAVADTGQGIWASLKRFPSFAESLKGDSQAILTALTLKVGQSDGSARPGKLSTLMATARKVHGELVCMSGDAAIFLRSGELRTLPITFYPGTVIGMRLRLYNPKESHD
jgi:hypothetical protein